MNHNDIANMADFIAVAIHKQVAEDGEVWGDLEEDERAQFRVIAHAAMGAYDAWLATAGYQITRPAPKVKRSGLVSLDGQPLGMKH